MNQSESNLKIVNETSWERAAGQYVTYFCQLIDQLVLPGWVCADIGAAFGLITERLAARVGPKGYVYAFEALPENAELLKSYMFDMGYCGRVRVENVAVAGRRQKAQVIPGRSGRVFEWRIVGQDEKDADREPALMIDAIALDDYFLSRTRLDLIKIDLEGMAGFAFTGMQRVLQESRPILLIEFHNETEWQSRKLLFDAGYRLWDLSNGYPVEAEDKTAQPYHCCAIPTEFQMNIRFCT